MILTENKNYNLICTHKDGITVYNNMCQHYEFWVQNEDGKLFWRFFEEPPVSYIFSHILSYEELQQINTI